MVAVDYFKRKFFLTQQYRNTVKLCCNDKAKCFFIMAKFFLFKKILNV